MYHKRVSGYSAMGYKALRESDYSEKSGIIFDSHNSLPMFNRDMGSSRHEIVIGRPYLRKTRMMQMLRLLTAAKINGVRISVITRPAENYKLTNQPAMMALTQSLAGSGIIVIQKPTYIKNSPSLTKTQYGTEA